MIVYPSTCLFDERGRKTEGKGLVVNELGVQIIIHLFFMSRSAMGNRTRSKPTHVPLGSGYCVSDHMGGYPGMTLAMFSRLVGSPNV